MKFSTFALATTISATALFAAAPQSASAATQPTLALHTLNASVLAGSTAAAPLSQFDQVARAPGGGTSFWDRQFALCMRLATRQGMSYGQANRDCASFSSPTVTPNPDYPIEPQPHPQPGQIGGGYTIEPQVLPRPRRRP